jgi:N-acyl-D-aspartate/D-glutamate deacylase
MEVASYLEALASYPLVISPIPILGLPNVRVLGEGSEGAIATSADLAAMRKAFAAEIAAR